MYNNLNKIIGSEKNKTQVNAKKDKLAKLIKEFKSSYTSDAKKKKMENRNNVLEVVERILEFNQLNQS